MCDTRERWLLDATEEIKALFTRRELGLAVPALKVSVGFPIGASKRNPNKRIGECWAASAASDQTHQIFISPVLENPVRILDVLIHEMIHACLPPKTGHRGAFTRAAKKVGREGKMTATVAGDSLRAELEQIADRLGGLPHASLSPVGGKKKQSTRMLKLECPDCGYVARTTQKWVDVGIPTCCCGTGMVLVTRGK